MAATPLLLLSAGVAIDAQKVLWAQAPATTPTFPVPAALPQGTTMKLDGSSSMAVINAELKKEFEGKFPGTTVNLASSSTDESLQALLNNTVDLAAIGRPLTDAEKAQGLKEIPVSREKIAIIVSSTNPFKGSLTSEQFAKVFRGEITNWSQVGGPDAPIRLIDRPNSSDTRQALSQYPVFRTAPFQTGSNATQVMNDDTAAVVKELGPDGISYAIASQVLDQPNITVLPMHETLPSDPRYPYSQARGYVYKGTPNDGVLAFIGFATSAPGQAAITAAKQQEAVAVQQGTTTASNAAPDTPTTGASPAIAAPDPAISTPAGKAPDLSPLLWLLLPLLGVPLLLWLFKGRGAAVPPAAIAGKGRMILTPRNAHDAYAYWEVPESEMAAARDLGGRDLKVRLADVTDIQNLDQIECKDVKEFDGVEGDPDLHLPIAVPNRDYMAEVGYLTSANQWLRLARSERVRVPAAATPGVVDKPAAISAAASAAATRIAADLDTATVEPPEAGMSARLNEMTGAVTGLAGDATKAVGAAIAGGTAAVAGLSPVVKSLLDRSAGDDKEASLEQTQDCRIILVPRNDQEAYAYWEVADSYKQPLRDQGGRRLMLRIHDATNLNIDREPPHSTQTYVCHETDQDKHVIIPMRDRDYIAELGYFTDDNRWLRIIRSFHVRVPADG